MAGIEVQKHFISESQESLKENLFPIRPETPEVTFAVLDIQGDFLTTTVRPSEYTNVYDVFQADKSVTSTCPNVELLGTSKVPYYHVGTASPEAPFLAQRTLLDGVSVDIFVNVTPPQTIELPINELKSAAD